MIIAIAGRIGSGKDTTGVIIQYLLHTNQEEKAGRVPIHTLKDYLALQGAATHTDWKVKKFAAKLKQVASLLTGIPASRFEDQNFKNSKLAEEWRVWYVRLDSAVHPIDERTKRVSQFFSSEQAVKDDWFKSGPSSHSFEIVSERLTARQFLQLLGTEAIRNGLHPEAWVNALFAGYKLQQNQYKDDTQGYSALPNWIITDLRFPNEFDAVKKREGLCIRVHRPEGSVIDPVSSFTLPAHSSETALDKHVYDYVLANTGSIDELVEDVRKMLLHFKLL